MRFSVVRLYGRICYRLTNLRKEIKKLKYIKLQEVDDISKIVLVVNDGKNLYDKLLNDYGIQLEMASVNYCIAMTSVGDKQVYYDRFIEALRELDTPENEYSGSYNPALVKAVVALNMYEADSLQIMKLSISVTALGILRLQIYVFIRRELIL